MNVKYRIKCFMGGELGWLYIVGDDGETPKEYSLEEAKEVVKQYECFDKKLYEIIDKEGNEYEI